MKNLLRLFPLLAALVTIAAARDADDFAAVRRADQRRIVATIASDTTALAPLLSDDLHYAPPDGRVQSKAEFLAATARKKIKYLSVVPEDVTFQPIAAGAVAMSGRARIVALAGGRRFEFTLRFLAVWRDESGQWRLLAYQSSQLGEPASSPAM